MSRWGQTKNFPRFPKSALHEFYQVRLEYYSRRMARIISKYHPAAATGAQVFAG